MYKNLKELKDFKNLKESKKMYNYYFLLYKLKRSPIFWIVATSQFKTDLINRIKHFVSKQETYYLIEKLCTEDEYYYYKDTYFKQFETFKLCGNCKIVYQTEN